MKKNQKLKIDITESDCEDLRDGVVMEWTFTTDKGEDIDLVVYNPDTAESCPRCIEDWEDEDGEWHDGEYKEPHCKECGVCKDCEHLSECSKSK